MPQVYVTERIEYVAQDDDAWAILSTLGDRYEGPGTVTKTPGERTLVVVTERGLEDVE